MAKKIIMYGNENCKDCVAAKAVLDIERENLHIAYTCRTKSAQNTQKASSHDEAFLNYINEVPAIPLSANSFR